MFDGLGDVDDIEVGVVVEDVVFGQVGVDKFADMVESAHDNQELCEQGWEVGLRD